MRTWTRLILAAAALAAMSAQAESTAKPAVIAGAQQMLVPNVGGRVRLSTTLTRTQGAVTIVTSSTYQWPGTYMEAAFMGPEVSVRLNDAANILHVRIDGQIVATLQRPGEIVKTFKDLGAGQHIIRVERLTESQGETGTFEGFFAPPGLALAIHPHDRQIEFIGDSYTVGYGNTAGKTQCTRQEVADTTDTSQAFGPLTATHYRAEYQINAISGRGIVRNYGGGEGDPLPVAYPYTLLDHTTSYINDDWHPQIIAIGLGTNDFSTPLHDGEKWKTRDDLHADYEATYVKFVQDLRARYPKAYFILMAADQFHGEMPGEINEVIARLNSQGEQRIAFLPMTGLNFGGCDGHPDTGDDRTVSDELIAFIDQHPDIWQGK